MVSLTLPLTEVKNNVLANGGCVAEAPQKPAVDKVYISYDEIHASISASVGKLTAAGWGTPDYLVGISGGGLIPARILRSALRAHSKQGGCAAIKVIGLELYTDGVDEKPHDEVVRTQWLELHKTPLVGKRILIVDEVDDSRATLSYAAHELLKDIRCQEEALAAEGRPVPETHLGVFVIHNKARPKNGELPEGVAQFVAREIPNVWCVYPWDAVDIMEHNRLGSHHNLASLQG